MVEMRLVHFITMAGVHVIIRWAISCAEILSAELGDDDCLVGWLSALASQTVGRHKRATEGSRSVVRHWGQCLPSLKILDWPFSSRGALTFSLVRES